jgi:hypothetical protein
MRQAFLTASDVFFRIIRVIFSCIIVAIFFIFKYTRRFRFERRSNRPSETCSRQEELNSVQSSVDVECVVEASDGYLEPRSLDQEPLSRTNAPNVMQDAMQPGSDLCFANLQTGIAPVSMGTIYLCCSHQSNL